MPQTYITTSWDDGHPLDARLAEMLTRHGLTGTFYIPRAISTGVMSDAALRDLSTRFEIGAHTLNHVFLTDTDPATAQKEITGSKKWVEDMTGKTCPMFCPPAGRYTSQHLPMFSGAGYRAIRTVEFLSLDRPRPSATGGENLLQMPTTLQAYPQSRRAYLRNMIKRRAFRNFALYTLHGRSQDWTTLARRLLKRAVDVGGVFHLWGHSWELEGEGLWDQLEQILRQMGECVAAKQATCLTNGDLCQLAAA